VTIDAALFSSAKTTWETPPSLFHSLNAVWRFTLDAAASFENAKVDHFFTEEQDGLAQDWGGEIVWVNPPFGKGIERWVQKAYEESQKRGTVVVMLLPVRTDTRYWQNWIEGKAAYIRFLPGRLKFVGAEHAAPFPSAIVVFGRLGG
jgi:phage N-6-adenine-methyltransferase